MLAGILGILYVVFSVAMLASIIWMMVLAITKEDYLWAVGCFFCSPLVGLIYGFMNVPRTTIPTILMVVSFIGLIACGLGAALLAPAAMEEFDANFEDEFGGIDEFEDPDFGDIEMPEIDQGEPLSSLKPAAVNNPAIAWA